MACAHERIKSVNCVLFCDICGAELPADYLKAKRSAQPQEAEKAAEKPQESAPKKTTRKKVK